MLADSSYASTVSGYVLTVIGGLILLLVGWICRTLVKQNALLALLMQAVYPPNATSLPDKIEDVRDDLREMRTKGSDRLKELLEETRLQRIENTQQARRLAESERRTRNASGPYPPSHL